MTRLPPRPTLFPYTTLFRSLKPSAPGIAEPRTGLSMGQHAEETAKEWKVGRAEQDELALASHRNAAAAWKAGFFERSEEHTSELQSLRHLVCRLLLEKKKAS